MRIKRSLFLAVLALLPTALLSAGCGGGGGGGDSNPIAGRYLGTFTTANAPQGGNQQGTVDLRVDQAGRITGTAFNTSINATATISGTINDEGQVQSTYTYPNLVAVVTGTVGFNNAGHMVGTLPVTVQGNPFGTLSIDLVRQ